VNKIHEVMKQLVIYAAVLALLSSCANQGNLAHYEDDGIYARPAASSSPTAGASDSYYFVDEGNAGSEQRSGEYYGSGDGDLAMADDYVPEARSLPSESGRAYNNQRYNSPTYNAGYATAMPITMTMGYSSFHSPFMYGGGMGMGMGMGFGYMDPWWGMGMYDPWHPWYRWNRWNRWNSWYSWNMWSPFGPYGMCYGGWGMGYGMGFGMGYHMGYGMGVNSYNWSGESQSNTYHGPRPGFGGGSFGSAGGSGAGSFDGINRGGAQRVPNQARTPARGDTPSRFDTPSRTDGVDRVRPNDGRTPNPNATRTPSTRPDNSRNNNDRSFFRWNTPRDNSPGTTRPAPGNSRPNPGYSPPSRGGAPAARPGSSSPSRNNFSRPSTPSRSPGGMSPSSPSRGGGSPSGGGGGSRGGFRR
jgi:hypothetical protein